MESSYLRQELENKLENPKFKVSIFLLHFVSFKRDWHSFINLCLSPGNGWSLVSVYHSLEITEVQSGPFI